MKLLSTQIISSSLEEIRKQIDIYNDPRTVTHRNTIPETNSIPISPPTQWLRIPDVISVFVDMKSSTQLSATLHDKSTAGAYQLFTGTAVRIFHDFDAPYIDVRGDGVFALFNSNQPYRAIAAAITFKTFAALEFTPTINDKAKLSVGCHIGIDQKTVLVRKLGLKRQNGNTDRQNEVWAGKPVNMSSKLASLGDDNQLLVSARYHANVPHDLVRKSCDCPEKNGLKNDLWTERDLTGDSRFDFTTAYVLKSIWCPTHGREYCEAILKLDPT